MEDFVKIDGSLGEGGGQVLRTALSVSAIMGTEIALTKIRTGRTKPGLKRQHLTCVKAVAEICGAKVTEVGIGSMELGFVPGPIKGGDYHFDVGMTGSVTIFAQTVIPMLLKADKPSTMTITGGTHVPFAPIWEFFVATYLPELRRMGARVEAELVQPGFYPAFSGVVKIRVWPFEAMERPPYALMELGEFHGGKVVGVVSKLPVAIAEAEVGIVGNQLRDLKLASEVRAVESFGPGNYCYVQLNYERCSIVFSAVGTHDKSRKVVAGEVVRQVRDYLKAGKACEKHLADQLLVPAAMFLGQRNYWWDCDDLEFTDWNVEVQKESKHFMANQEVIRSFAMAQCPYD